MSPESYISEKFSINEVKKTCETCLLWEEAGFIPSKKDLYLIEYLHLSFLNGGDIAETDLQNRLSENITKSALQSGDSVYISDPEKMYRFAADMKIEIGNKDDKSIAAMITEEIIAEYMSIFNFHDLLRDNRNPEFH